MRDYFYSLSERIFAQLDSHELGLMNLDGEESDFVRLNHAKVRQAGTVHQAFVELTLVLPKTRQQASQVLNLVNSLNADETRLKAALEQLRAVIKDCPRDPFLVVNEINASSELTHKNELADSHEVVNEICSTANKLDLVGVYGAGGIFRGFANSLGQRNWYETYSFNFDWSCYLRADKAVKANYAGFSWDPSQFANKMDVVREQLALLQRPSRKIAPGGYRAYLSPAAMGEIAGVLKWGSFSEKALRTKQSCFSRMREKNLRLHRSLQLAENMTVGVAPGFDRQGFPRPDKTMLIADGGLRQGMISARTSKEYDIDGNGADREEAPNSLEIGAGSIAPGDVLKVLNTGLLINNLWYLNYSDRTAGRITGMTRFATFWVEKGEVIAPLEVMRFDDSIYRFWGENLLGLSQDRELCFSPSTYFKRDTSSALLPGAMIDDFRLTL